jgi:hypothetical protein
MTAHQLSRGGFLRVVVGLVAAGAVLEACGSDNPDGAATSSGSAVSEPSSSAALSSCKTYGAKDGGIDDPKHHLIVPAADIAAGVSKTYSIQGTETHDHNVTLEAADFAKLATDTRVFVTSTKILQHMHTFEVVCA